MNITWKKLEDQSYEGFDENGNRYRQPANQETTTVYLTDGRTCQGWTPREAFGEAVEKEVKPRSMKAKDLIKALQDLDPEANVVINIKQFNKVYGFQLPIHYGTNQLTGGKENYDYLHSEVNASYGGSITVHLPDGAYVSGLPENMKSV